MTNHPDPASIHKIVLGTVQFGLEYGISNTLGKTTHEEVENILDVASQNGIDLLDTAFSYGNSEEVIGKISLRHPGFKIVSKFPKPEGKSISEYLQKSLERLQVSSLYAYLAHQADVLIENPELWNELAQLQTDQVILKKGYSVYSPQQLEQLLDMNMIPDLVQLPYNVFDQRFKPLLTELKKYKTEIHARSAFLQGLFFVDPDSLPTFFDSVKPLLKEIRSMFPTTDELSGALLYFCISEPLLDRVVIGVNNAEQLIQNLNFLNTEQHAVDWKKFEVVDEAILLPYLWPGN